MAELLSSNAITCGFVYYGNTCEEYWFQGTPENIAAFIARFPNADRMVLTDTMDELVLDTIGWYIDTCPDKRLLEEVKKHLIPIQMGMAEPGEFFCPTIKEENAYYDEKQGMDGMRFG